MVEPNVCVRSDCVRRERKTFGEQNVAERQQRTDAIREIVAERQPFWGFGVLVVRFQRALEILELNCSSCAFKPQGLASSVAASAFLGIDSLPLMLRAKVN